MPKSLLRDVKRWKWEAFGLNGKRRDTPHSKRCATSVAFESARSWGLAWATSVQEKDAENGLLRMRKAHGAQEPR
jgi:hypothetical protein